MKKIVITTDRKPFIHGIGQPHGAEIEVHEDVAKVLINNGMAELVEAPKKAPAKAPAKKAGEA